MRHTIKVTQEHIDAALAVNSQPGLVLLNPSWNEHCPVACALNEQLGGMWAVTASRAWELGGGRRRLEYLGNEAASFIHRIDASREASPFEFTVEVFR